MAEKENVNPADVSAQAPAKKKRRGISNETRSTSQLQFHEKDAANNNLFIGHIEDVQVNWSNTGGIFAPRLIIHIASEHKDVDQRRHLYKSLFSVESNVDTIPNGKDDWKVNALFGFIKHLLEVLYLRGRQFTEEEEDALSLDFEDYDDTGAYVPVDPDTVFKAYGVLFENVAAMLNGSFNLADGETAKPCYKDANGKPIKLWLKLLRCTKRKNEWSNVEKNGELGLPTFIGAGVIEIYDPKTNGVPRILRVDLSKESITPKQVDKTPSIGTPGMGGIQVPTGMPQMPVDNGAFNAAGAEMPF